MAKRKSNRACPECGSAVRAWADIDARLSFEISSSGKLVKRSIKNTYQSDGRAGVECSLCSWSQHIDDMAVDSPFLPCAEAALERQAEIGALRAEAQEKVL